MRKILVTPGEVYGRLMLLCEAPPVGRRRRRAFFCKCDCGNFTVVVLGDLRSGCTTSCGCYQKEVAAAARTTHGGYGTKLFSVWRNAKARCYNPKNKRWARYGGRGIEMHSLWKREFTAFRDYVTALPAWPGEDGIGNTADELSLDRIDNDVGYFPGNLRWATKKQQANNRSR
jgi:hypothetical protein